MLPTTHRFDEVFAPVAVVEETSPEAPTVAMADNDPEAAPWNWDLAPHRMHVVEEYLGSEEIVLPGGAGQWELVWLGGLSSLLPAQGRKAFRSWPCRPLRSSTVCGRGEYRSACYAYYTNRSQLLFCRDIDGSIISRRHWRAFVQQMKRPAGAAMVGPWPRVGAIAVGIIDGGRGRRSYRSPVSPIGIGTFRSPVTGAAPAGSSRSSRP